MVDNINMQNLRPYEVSIWSLQDRFLSVLKWANMNQRGRIQDPEMVLRDDGTQEFTFSIPQFYYEDGVKILNPMWIFLDEQPLEANMHKLKVIFNKNTDDEKILEFLVTAVTSDHTSDEVSINIKTEGLAFHELGKIGYKINLSIDNYTMMEEQWFNNIKDDSPEELPQMNIQYWNDLIFKDSDGNWRTNWKYKVQMDWSSYSFNETIRESDKVYEEEYISAWENVIDEAVTPKTVEKLKEKWRPITVEDSNYYNATQTIAEQFGVFCKYEYEYNENYQIIGRTVVYYNNYMNDFEGHTDLTYPYAAQTITRTVDNTALTTKLFVKSVDDEDYGTVSIMDVEANKSGEDYILNFDYLYSIGAITDEQKDEIKKYEDKMHILNKESKSIIERISTLTNQLNDENALVTYYTNAISLDEERRKEAIDAKIALTGGTDYIPLETTLVVMEDNDKGYGKYVNVSWQGLDYSSMQLFETRNLKDARTGYGYDDSIASYQLIFDEFDNVVRIQNIIKTGDSNIIYILGQYNPSLYYDKLKDIWTKRLGEDTKKQEEAQKKVDLYKWYLYGEHTDYDTAKVLYVNGDDGEKLYTPDLLYNRDRLLKEKEILSNKFERMMGPALREGYWVPEDYKDHGDVFSDNFIINETQPTTEHLSFIWDSEKYYENESSLTYVSNTAGDEKYHLVIDVSEYLNHPTYWNEFVFNFNKLFFCYYSEIVVKERKQLEEKITQLTENEATPAISLLQDYYQNEDQNDVINLLLPTLVTPYNENTIKILDNILSIATERVNDPSMSKEGYTQVINYTKTAMAKCNALISLQKQYDSLNGKDLSEGNIRTYGVNSECEFGWIRSGDDTPIPVLIVTGTDILPSDTINYIKTGEIQYKSSPDDEYIQYLIHEPEMEPFIGYYSTQDNNGKTNTMLIKIPLKVQFIENVTEFERVYPRLYFNTLKLKNYSSNLHLKLNYEDLTINNDYYIVQDDRSEGEDLKGIGYYLTFRPQKLMPLINMTNSTARIDIMYTLLNSDISIYLDAIAVSKENAYPKVLYDVQLSVLNPEFIHTAYSKLNSIVHINDNDLKLEDASGYISSVTLKLDKPWEDTVEIKNYQTKFEDLFSTIVAQTEAMKKSEMGLNTVIKAFNADGLIDTDVLSDSFLLADLDMYFNQGKLQITQDEGIWGISDSGVVAFRGGGIFTATEKDANGKWIWNTGILPIGINANLITTGQLDTNRIKVYAGDELRFQLNGEGLYAYKGKISEEQRLAILSANEGEIDENDISDINRKQYVVYNSNGLFLRAEAGASVLRGTPLVRVDEDTGLEETVYKTFTVNGEKYYQIDLVTGERIPELDYSYEKLIKTVDRVEVSWEGFILRNWDGDKVFYADPDTGNLTLKGTIMAEAGRIGGWEITKDRLSGLGINLISGQDSNNTAGIYLSDPQQMFKSVTDKDGITYYIYTKKDEEDGQKYYITRISNQDETTFSFSQDEIYQQNRELVSVVPKYQRDEKRFSNNGSVDYTGTEETQTDTDYNFVSVQYQAANASAQVYIVQDRASVNETDESKVHYLLDSDGNKIAYDFITAPNALWYEKLKNNPNLPGTISDYVNEAYDITYTRMSSPNGQDQIVLTATGGKGYTFSVQAADGAVSILKGQIGLFELNASGLNGKSNGIITSSILDRNNIIQVGDNQTNESFGKVFYDIIADSNAGTFTLKRINGEEANFNIAAMQAYKNAIAAAASIQLTINKTGSTIVATATSGGGITVTKTLTIEGDTIAPSEAWEEDSSGSGNNTGICRDCEKSCFHSCAHACQGNTEPGASSETLTCNTNCIGHCSSCSGGCKDTCKDGCFEGCLSTCKGECVSCGGACEGNCTTGCRDGCYTSCYGGCKNKCGTNCEQNCGIQCSGGSGIT